MPKPIVLIPLGGLGQRFADAGYSAPKPLVKALGEPVLYWLLKSLDASNVSKVLIPFHPDLATFRLDDQLRKDFDLPFHFVKLPGNTQGAADTVRIALQQLQEEDNEDAPIISLDGDNFYTLDILSLWAGRNCLVTFHDTGNQPIYSYVQVRDGKIVQIKEKVQIGTLACTGAYGFSSWKRLLDYAKKTLSDEKHKQKNEFYISSVIALMLEDNVEFEPVVVPRDSYVCLGTPLQLRAFCNDFPRRDAISGEIKIKPRRYCFDLDNTLVTFPRVKGDYSTVEPISYMIDFLKYLKKFNHTVIIYTARRMATHKGNVAATVADIGRVTFDTLDKFEIPYDEIVFGKPLADCYIDDLGVSAFGSVEKDLGYYMSEVKPRVFNDISHPSPIQLVRKTSMDAGLSGEIYYYNHVPLSIKDCFPIMLSFDENSCWYQVEHVSGSTASNLLLSQDLTPTSIKAIMGTLHRLHTATDVYEEEEINIYANYSQKVRQRYNDYAGYAKFPDSHAVFDRLVQKLEDYETEKRGKCVVIHGDPVMSNIIVNGFGKVKLIDMRGELGDTLTIRGDEAYDWAKLYQSLIGYDEAMHKRKISEQYRQTLTDCFWETLENLSPEIRMDDVGLLTQSLLFSLLPMHTAEHEVEKQHSYYGLIEKMHCGV